MRVLRHPGNIRRMLDSRLKRVLASKPLLAASLATITKTCGNSSCHCHHGGEKHQAHHLTYKVRGKTHTIYVPFDFTEEVRSWIEEHRRLKRLLQEITQLSLALVRCHAQEQKQRRGRS
jgi:DNA-binding transcriptional regulator LsrR (DeoR family)